MRKYLFFASLFIACLIVTKSKADMAAGLIGGGRAWNYTAVAASSASIFVGSGELGAIYLSSGTSTSTADWAIAIDTSVGDSVTLAAFANSQRMTPALIFESSGTITSGDVAASTAQPRRGNYEKKWDETDGSGNGIRFSNGLFLLKTSANSGEAFRAVVKWRR